MLYEIEYWLVTGQQQKKFNVVEAVMMHWMSGHIR